MHYWVLVKLPEGELIQVSDTEQPVAPEGHIVKQRMGEIPDLNKFEWHGGSLAFVPKSQGRIITRLAFMRRLSNEELAGIYSTAKVQPLLEVWLDKFKLAEEINLDDEEIVSGLQWLEYTGLLSAGRAAEVLV